VGQWVDASGEPIRIEKASFGWDVWLAKYGQAAIVESNGEFGSHVKVSGRTNTSVGYECYYYISLLSSRQMSWALRHGDPAICPSLGLFTRAFSSQELSELDTLKKQLEDEKQRLDEERRRLDANARAKTEELRYRQATLDAREAELARQRKSQSGSGVYVRPHWCAEQSRFTDPETAICSNSMLSQLDIQMEAIFGALVQSRSASSIASIRVSQRAWVQRRNFCGSDMSCLRQLYEGRIQELNSL
jgi:uncharacterized protein YecT (DUF1311 family)